jgi:putative CocE/NonD family hydrolase
LTANRQADNDDRQVSQPRYGMRVERCAVPMPDGVRLAVTLYQPDGALETDRFPALLEVLPYRKDDGTVLDDAKRYAYFARRGYVGARVDVRGTGASEGVADDQYCVQEGQDALALIAWLARQPWSNGRVGMWGLSYGGFNSIQVAMLRPPALKAIVAVGATDDVYTDDIVYWNGALEFESMGRWPPSMIAMNGLPGYPDYDPDSPAARARFEQEPWLLHWLRAQRDGPYWRRMSLRPRYEVIDIPVMLIGGWLDGYPDSIPRMVEHVKAPVRAIIGPWPHAWPDEAVPGPQIDSNYEMLRWWDRWLKGFPSGIVEESSLAIYVQGYYSPDLHVRHIPGEWRCEAGWPLERVVEEVWYPQPDETLEKALPGGFSRRLECRPTMGTSSRYRLPHNPAELYADQRVDDAHSMSFTGTPLERDVEIVGHPRAVLHVSSSAAVTHWVVRLCDVAPDGSSLLVSKAVLNGTHRRSHADPEPIAPGEVVELSLDLKVVAWRFSKGHRVRLAISTADFPNIWPAPERAVVTLVVDSQHPSRLLLPVCQFEQRPDPGFRAPPPEPEQFPRRPSPVNEWQVIRDEMRQTTTVFRETVQPEHPVPDEDGEPITVYMDEKRWCVASDVEPARASLTAEAEHGVRRGGVLLVSRAHLNVESDEAAFHVVARRELIRDGEVLRSKGWEERIPRDHL